MDRSIVDTGTTNFRVPGIKAPDGFWHGYQVMCWMNGTDPFEYFPSLTISLSSTISENLEFSLLIPPQLYLREAPGDQIRGTGQQCYRYAISRSEKGIVIGAVLMEGFYIVFDRERSRIGFAESTCQGSHAYFTLDNGGVSASARVLGPYNRNNFEDLDNIIKLMVYVLFGICVISILPCIVLILKSSVGLLIES